MRRIVVPRPFEIEIEEAPDPEPPRDGALARGLISGISAGTERMWFDGSNPAIRSGRRGYPYYPGYEFVGEVVATGEEARGVRTGDRIFAMAPHAELAALRPGDNWFVLPDELAAEDALITALTMTAVHAIHRAGMTMGDTVAVVGLGMVGLALAQAAACAGTTVIGIARSPARAEQGRRLGLSHLFVADDDRLTDQIRALTDDRGPDIVFECAGQQSAVDLALELVRRGGKIVIEGFHVRPFAVSGETLFAKELEIVGVRSGGGADLSYEYLRWSRTANFRAAAALVTAGKVVAAPLVTHRFPWQSIRDAYQLLVGRREPYLQIVLDWRAPP